MKGSGYAWPVVVELSRRTLRAKCPTKGLRLMGDMTLDIAFWNYDRTRALMDGTVKIDGWTSCRSRTPPMST